MRFDNVAKSDPVATRIPLVAPAGQQRRELVGESNYSDAHLFPLAYKSKRRSVSC